MTVQLSGLIKKIFKPKEINNHLTVNDLVITVQPNSPFSQDIIIGALNEKIERLQGYKVGDSVTVKCNLRGREKDGKYYIQLNMYEISREQSN